MKDYLKAYKVKILVMSPTFVGSGKKISKKEYRLSTDAQKVVIYDPAEFYRLMQNVGKASQYENFLMNDGCDDLETWMQDNRIGNSSVEKAVRYSVSSDDQIEFGKSKIKIKEFAKDPYGFPYVPGTSIKGMLRTILLGYEISQNPGKYSQLKERIKGFHPSYSKETKDLEIITFNTLSRKDIKTENAANDNLQGLVISDSKPLRLEDLVLCQKIEYHTNGDEKPLDILRECLRSGTCIEFTITIDTQVCPYDIDKIKKAIEVFNDMYYDCFLSKFNFEKEPPDTVYLGGGVGFVSKTIIYSLFGAEEGVEVAQNVFRHTLKRDLFISHGHQNDALNGVSPHILKCTRMNGERFQMGMCKFIIEDM